MSLTAMQLRFGRTAFEGAVGPARLPAGGVSNVRLPRLGRSVGSKLAAPSTIVVSVIDATTPVAILVVAAEAVGLMRAQDGRGRR